jgi:hypothetical protein
MPATSNPKLARHPLAWGMTRWGPLPDTESLYLFWGGPGSGIYLEHGIDGGQSGQTRVRHASASGTYDTAKQAQRAVEAFVSASEESSL